MISAPRHILLLFCNPVHLVTCYELPLYQPTPEESADPKLYAANVRRQMVRVRTCVWGAWRVCRCCPRALTALAYWAGPDDVWWAGGHHRHLF